jgi:hypothetical protein
MEAAETCAFREQMSIKSQCAQALLWEKGPGNPPLGSSPSSGEGRPETRAKTQVNTECAGWKYQVLTGKRNDGQEM